MDARIQIMLALVLLASSIQAYPTGAPSMACSNLDPSPGHGPSTNRGPAPYEVKFSAEEYTPGNPVEVTLSGINGEMFEGFLIQGFPADGSSTVAVGTFEIPDGAVFNAVCQTTTGNGVTHKDKNKKSKVTLQWTAPKDTRQDIVFHYTVVRGNSGAADYFKDQQSAVLKAASPNPNSHFQKDRECGKTKGCYGNCNSVNSCDWLVTWQQEGPRVRLNLASVFTSDNKYVALGFSEQDKMAKASVVSCRLHNGIVDVIESTNPEYANKPLNNGTEGLSDIHGSHINSLLQCSFLREITSPNPDIFNLTDPWNLITARGNLTSDGSLDYHYTDRYVTEQKVKVPNSVDISFGGDTTTTTAQPKTTPKVPNFPKDPACGKTKGCYSNCQADGTCDWLVSWSKRNNETATIELTSTFSSDNKYVAVGFSERPGMFKASVLACRLQNSKVNSVASFNPSYSNSPLPNPAVDSSHGSFVSGVLKCSMLRNKTSDNPQVFNLTEPWYLITARGDLSNGILQQHDTENRYVTNTKIDVMNSIQDVPFDQAPGSTLPTTPSAPAKSFPKDPECGKTKGCYSNCNGGVCNFLMSWKKEGDKFEISLKSGFDSKDNNYVALGLGKAKGKMSPASVIQCVTSGGTVSSTLSYNPGYYNKVLPSNDQSFLTQIQNSFKDGVLSCTLSRRIKSNLTEVFSMDQKWYLISARGNAPGGVLQQHDAKNRFFTSSQVDLNDMTVDISLEESTYPLIKAHGCLMILAWILSASIGIGMARYFKPVWPDTTVCGVKVWFAIHRSAMVLTFCMGVSAFVIIFVQVEGYSEIIGEDYKRAHPILGIIVTALLVVNPFMSLLRCSPDHPQRPLFNWAHFIVGTSAHILSAVTIALGLYLPKAQTDGETGLIIIIIYGSWQVLFFCIMSAFEFIAKNDKNDYSNLSNINPTTESYEQQESKKETPMSSAKQWVMGFHVIVITTVAVYLMYMIIDTNV